MAAQQPEKQPAEALRSTYVLGVDDQVAIRASDVEEMSGAPFRIGASGYINLPLVGRVQAAGLTVEQFESELVSRLKTYIQEPQVSLNIVEFRSQPVSVIGEVNTPGIHQLQGRRTLIEMLAMAGGIRADAGNSINITRRLEWGRIPLPRATDDPSGQFSVAQVNLKAVLDATNPEQNILIRPYDVITIPRAEMVYVIGDVSRSGGFVLNERESVTVLQALSLAGGLNRTAAPKNSKVLRATNGAATRTEIPIDLKAIFAGKAADTPLRPDDILFIPSSARKSAAFRTLEVALGMGANIGTGVAIYRR